MPKVRRRRIGRTLDPDGTPESQFFIYDGDRIIQELDGSGNLVAAWDYGVYIDEILVMYRDVVAPAGLEPYYYLQDDHYNVIGLADASGNVVERYAYDDYGAPSFYDGNGNQLMDGAEPATRSAYGNPFLFQGRRWDEVLSLYDYRTRYYDPAIGRFLRIDTIGLWGDANNLGNPYAFVGNNPWTHLDPYGEGVFTLLLIGDYNSSDWEALKGFGEGATGGATIVADTFTFNSIDSLNAKANTYQGAAYTGSRILATVSREAAIAAATGGIGNAAAKGGQAAQVAHKGILIYEAGRGGYDVGTGINQIAEGDTAGGILSITGGVVGGAGSFANARAFGKALDGAGDAGRGFSLNSSDELMGIEKASDELLSAVARKRTVKIAEQGSEDMRYLDYMGAEANVGGPDLSHILLRPNPSKAAVLEEFLHGTQQNLGMIDRLGRSGAERHVKDFMIRHRKLLGLANEDVEILKILMEKGL